MSRLKIKKVALRQLSRAIYARRVGRFEAARVWYNALRHTCDRLAQWGGARSGEEWFSLLTAS